MNPISSARPQAHRPFIWVKREAQPWGVRFGIGRLQGVVGYLNRFALWWHYRPLVDFYRSKPILKRD